MLPIPVPPPRLLRFVRDPTRGLAGAYAAFPDVLPYIPGAILQEVVDAGDRGDYVTGIELQIGALEPLRQRIGAALDGIADGKSIVSGTADDVVSDLVSVEELACLADVTVETFRNALSKARKAGKATPEVQVPGSGRRGDRYSYAEARPFLRRTWPKRAAAGLFPEAFAKVKAFLNANKTRR